MERGADKSDDLLVPKKEALELLLVFGCKGRYSIAGVFDGICGVATSLCSLLTLVYASHLLQLLLGRRKCRLIDIISWTGLKSRVAVSRRKQELHNIDMAIPCSGNERRVLYVDVMKRRVKETSVVEMGVIEQRSSRRPGIKFA